MLRELAFAGVALGAAAAASRSLGTTRWRMALLALGFPVSLLATGIATSLPPWAWLIPLGVLLLLYPLKSWRDAPLFPTPCGALAGLPRLVPVAPGEMVRTEDVAVNALKTKPPARYTEATLLSAMEGAGKLIDDDDMREAMQEKGLGTPATRAAIIEGLIYEKYIHREGRELVPGAKVLPAWRRGNIVGAIEMGLRQGEEGLSVLGIAKAAASGNIECLVLLGCDPLADFPDTDLARRMMAGAPRIIAIDTFLTKSNASADVLLAAAAYGEKSGTTTNIEGRVTTLSARVTPRGTSRPDWMIATELAELLGVDLGVSSVDDLTEAIAANVTGFGEATVAALHSARDGIVCHGTLPPATARVATIDERNSYDYRLVVSRKLYDNAVGTAKSPSLAHLTTGSELHLHPLDIERVGSTDGADVKVTSKRASMVFTVVADDSVVRGSAWVPFNQPGPSIGELIDSAEVVTDVRVESF